VGGEGGGGGGEGIKGRTEGRRKGKEGREEERRVGGRKRIIKDGRPPSFIPFSLSFLWREVQVPTSNIKYN
jgi:hypothetical protein